MLEFIIKDIEFPENPTTTHLKKTIEWLLKNCDPVIKFANNGPFVFGAGIRFIISKEGDKVETPDFPLEMPMYVLHEGMPRSIFEAIQEEYDLGDIEEPTIN